MSFDPITAVLDIGGKLIDKLIPDPQAKAQAMLQLEQMKQNGELARMTNETDLAKIDEADRDSARQREMAVKDRTTPLLAWMVILASIVMGIVIVGGYSTAMKDPAQSAMVGAVLGYVFSEAKQVLAYYFGSSAGSRAKDDTISKLSQ